MRIGLVGCVKGKRSRPAPARELYTSALFLGRRAFVEATCERWFILSAKHGWDDRMHQGGHYSVAGATGPLKDAGYERA
jgi:hypothetical protein